eukprot:TRINITY_DN29281_c0_g1_i1.p1 TRINITY_DN29281_c0_g1~~TRINITY_DN29281_c0_g1_i1.p1  ORF type:complete len:186 (-),score=-11.56 TRINITY_DN29281_c0_g1_i1:423-926(-)
MQIILLFFRLHCNFSIFRLPIYFSNSWMIFLRMDGWMDVILQYICIDQVVYQRELNYVLINRVFFNNSRNIRFCKFYQKPKKKINKRRDKFQLIVYLQMWQGFLRVSWLIIQGMGLAFDFGRLFLTEQKQYLFLSILLCFWVVYYGELGVVKLHRVSACYYYVGTQQ